MQEHRQENGIASEGSGGGGSPRILIVRPTALGDVCRTVPVLATLRAAYSDARIDWLVNEPFVEAVKHHPALNEAIAFPRSRFGEMWRRPTVAAEAFQWARDIYKRRYDIVFDLQGLARSGLATWLTRAKRRVGFANAREGAWLGYNRRRRVDAGLHTVDRMLGLAEAEGYRLVRDMRLYSGEADRAWLKEALEHRAAGEAAWRAGFVCLAPTAQWRCKCWPIEKYVDITRRILSEKPEIGGVMVLAAAHEQREVEPLAEAFAGDRRVWLPQTTIGQMMAIIEGARIVVCNDSAALHMAVGFDRPAVAIFGPTDPAFVGPYGRPGDVIRPAEAAEDGRSYRRHREDQTLIAKVEVETVWRAVAQRLEMSLGARSGSGTGEGCGDAKITPAGLNIARGEANVTE